MDSTASQFRYAPEPALLIESVNDCDLWHRIFLHRGLLQLTEIGLCHHEQFALGKVSRHPLLTRLGGWGQARITLCHSCHHTNLWSGWHIEDGINNWRDCCQWWSDLWGSEQYEIDPWQICRWRRCSALETVNKSIILLDLANLVTGWHIWIGRQYRSQARNVVLAVGGNHRLLVSSGHRRNK